MNSNKILKLVKNIIINVIIFILSIIAILAIWSFIQISVQEKEYANIFGYSFFSTETRSMATTIEKGDIVLVKIGQDELKKNDIITYKNDNAIITHRIIEIDGDSIIAKGDNNNTEDAPIEKEDVIGKVIFIVNNVEIWKKVFSDKSVIIPIFITVILFIILVSYKEKRTDTKLTGEKND